MEKIKIVTDSASDILDKYVKEYDIDVIPFKIVVGDKSYVSNVDFDNEEFYKILDSYDGIPATSQITPFEFEEYYNKMFEEGYTDLVLVLINSQGSATYNNSIMAKDSFFEEHPEAEGKINIHTFDGKSYNCGYGWAVIEAAKMVKEGSSVDDVLKSIEEQLTKTCIYFGMYSLTYAAKSGRIPSAAAFVGDAIGLKPVMKIWDHEITTAGKVRGEKKLMSSIVSMAIDEMEEGSPYAVIYGNDKSVADELAERLTKELGYPPLYGFQIGAAVAINAGPKVVGVGFNSKNRTSD
ncbi:MAG: DegV family protein [Lachnospiraceae bacterium]|nr:DegV family protein [Lachnospiraceae bacterium]